MPKPLVSKSPTPDEDIRWNILKTKANEQRSLQAFNLFREQGIEPILIKGAAAARLYPPTKLRDSIDIDLAVGDVDFSAASIIAESASADGLAIDLHRELRHLDSVAWADLFDNSREMDFGGGSIRVLRPEDHLRVLCVHWLTDGGANRDRLWDIYYAIDNRLPDFDWDRFLMSVNHRRRRWLTCAVGLADKYLGLSLGNTPLKNAAREIPAWVIKTVEKEWAEKTKARPLDASLNDSRALARQIRKRLRPNPISATVQIEGSLDARTRIFYQAGDFFKRIMPSFRRTAATLRRTRNG